MSYTITRVNKNGNNFHYLNVADSIGNIDTFEQDCTVELNSNVFTIRGASGAFVVIDKILIAVVGSTTITTQTATEIHTLIMALLA